MAMTSLNDLFVHFLRDIYYAEKQGVKAMRKLARQAGSAELKSLIMQHREETEQQIEHLNQVFEQLELRPRGVRCAAIDGIAEEADEIMEEAEEGRTRDCGIVAAVQAVEHYEITRYGTLIAWAESLGHADAVPLLQQNLDQEIAADKKLSQLAEQTLNPAATDAHGGSKASRSGTTESSTAATEEMPAPANMASKADDDLAAMAEEVDADDIVEADDGDTAPKPKSGGGRKPAGGGRGRSRTKAA